MTLFSVESILLQKFAENILKSYLTSDSTAASQIIPHQGHFLDTIKVEIPHCMGFENKPH